MHLEYMAELYVSVNRTQKNPQMPSGLALQTRSRRWVSAKPLLRSLFEGMSAMV